MTRLSQTAILVALNVRTWSARRYDDKASETVAKVHHSKRDMGRYNKCLIDVHHKSFVAIGKAATAARTYHYGHTLAWVQKGACLLPAAMNLDYSAGMTGIQEEFEQSVEDFLAEYPNLKDKARKELNGLYVESEYPSVEELESKFGFEIIKFPVPDVSDFRANVSEEEAKAIKEQIEKELERASVKAMNDLWHRLHTAVKNMAESLKVEDKRFHDTLVQNVRDVASLLPKMNVLNDPMLNLAGEAVLKHLTKTEPEELRKDKGARSEVAKKADELAAKIAGFL